ncbi:MULTISPECIES: NAD(P)-dependent oxidoreductase [unclassified Sporosarcina]|uniref:NAD(P)-dependent oxidoreductase n=1 Tax=unclassified Sporosarcina TaxID=2647733 RepID=UPI00204006F0|nr:MULTISPECIES: NAD(P)-dependent oxidoreductase [unclassified Sporosarcina]GKV65914.1 3-hydroxyisobutyrate dehydrogenase [Sporosarcina sp. NCCP-2331]GLB56086.1 3-hydroxyisobutyrate dehydrogenase [Sporosarcina sp. NCCP-2378]
MKLGFIGLGNMGFPMATNLVRAGYEVYGLNRSKAKEKVFEKMGGEIGKEIAELAQSVDVLMTCLPMPVDVENVFLREEGIISSGRNDLIILDFSTIPPDLNKKIYKKAKEKGINYLDAPISGGTTGAELGTLSIMVGGDIKVYNQVLPILEVMGNNIFHTGDIGSGSTIKLINQYMVGIHTQAVAEALVMGEQNGINTDLMYEIFSTSFAQSRIFDRHYTQFISEQQFQAGFALKLLMKDLKLAGEMNQSTNLQLPLGEVATRIISEAANDEKFGQLDMAAMYKFVKENQKMTRSQSD